MLKITKGSIKIKIPIINNEPNPILKRGAIIVNDTYLQIDYPIERIYSYILEKYKLIFLIILPYSNKLLNFKEDNKYYSIFLKLYKDNNSILYDENTYDDFPIGYNILIDSTKSIKIFQVSNFSTEEFIRYYTVLINSDKYKIQDNIRFWLDNL